MSFAGCWASAEPPVPPQSYSGSAAWTGRRLFTMQPLRTMGLQAFRQAFKGLFQGR